MGRDRVRTLSWVLIVAGIALFAREAANFASESLRGEPKEIAEVKPIFDVDHIEALREGEVRKVIVTLKNTSAELATISKLLPGCTCGKDKIIDGTIPAGSTGRVQLEFGEKAGSEQNLTIIYRMADGNARLLVANFELDRLLAIGK